MLGLQWLCRRGSIVSSGSACLCVPAAPTALVGSSCQLLPPLPLPWVEPQDPLVELQGSQTRRPSDEDSAELGDLPMTKSPAGGLLRLALVPSLHCSGLAAQGCCRW
jgi:hypothetical protein